MKNYIFILSLAISASITISCVHIRTNKVEMSHIDKNTIIKNALSQEFLPTNTVVLEEANIFCTEAMKKVEEANYEEAINIISIGLRKFPENFKLQYYLAALLGDTSEITSEPLKNKMVKKSKTMFNKLLVEADKQPKEIFYPFKNEYFYRYGKYLEQYKLGLERVAAYWGTNEWKALGIKGYYSQGVGAANYAKKLLINGNKKSAREYAQKALVAWAQYFSYTNDYYNAYVHYALALGILGHKEEVLRALQRSASIIHQDLSYHEFKEVIDFFDNY